MLFSSHILSEVEALCERVVVIARGRIVGEGTPAELGARLGRSRLEDIFLELVRRTMRTGARVVSVLAVAGKELVLYFTSLLFYALASVFLVLAGWLFYTNLDFYVRFGGMNLVLGLWQYQFYDMRQLLLVLVPLLTMRLFAEERRLGHARAALDVSAARRRDRRRQVPRLPRRAGRDHPAHARLPADPRPLPAGRVGPAPRRLPRPPAARRRLRRLRALPVRRSPTASWWRAPRPTACSSSSGSSPGTRRR